MSLAKHSVGKKKPLKRVGKYVLGDTMGEGAYGKVKEGVDTATGRRVAVKIIHKKTLKKMKRGQESLRREIRCLKLVRHTNVVELIEVLETEEKIFLVCEYVSHGSVTQLVSDHQDAVLPLEWTRSFFLQMLEGLEACHSKGVVHRDIKPANLLVTAGGVIKISDFGVSELLDQWEGDKCVTWSGSPAFQAPELCSGSEVFSAVKVDIWAAGVTLYFLAFGKAPFEGESMCDLFENISKGEFEIPEGTDEGLASLLKFILVVDVEARPTIDQIKRHPWLHPPPAPPKLPSKETGPQLMQRLMDDEAESDDDSEGECAEDDDDDEDTPTTPAARRLPGEDVDSKKCVIQ